MTQIFGDFVEAKTQNEEFLTIGFSPSSVPLQHRWRNNGLSADFLADYLSTFFPGDDDEALDRQAEIKGAVNYVANELLENAMKFNYAPTQHSVSITMQLGKDNVRFYVLNSIDPQSTADFQAFIHKLLTEDTDELYMEQLMHNVEEEDDDDDEANGGSGLGFLTMLNDYDATLAWKFEPLESKPEVIVVTTMVTLPV
jgi:hypothetical protein